VEEGLKHGEAFARELQTKAESILMDCAIRFVSV
jgi:hypothetical protein